MAGASTGGSSTAIETALKRGFRLSLNPESSDSTPLVVLLGWYGCKDRYLAKYGALVGDLGYDNLRGTLPVEHIWWPWDGGRVKFARLLLEVLLDTGLSPKRPLVFFCFSNGGAFVLEECYKLFKSNPKYQPVQRSVVAIILDSAPSFLYPSALHESSVMTVGESYPQWTRPLIWAITWVFVALVLFMSCLLDGFRPIRAKQYWCAPIWTWWETVDYKAPLLFLYSNTDSLCNTAKLEGLIATRKSKGDEVTSTRWEESEHVGHFKRYPAQYTAAVSLFLNRVLSMHAPSILAAQAEKSVAT